MTASTSLPPSAASRLHSFVSLHVPRTNGDASIKWEGRFVDVKPGSLEDYQTTRMAGKVLSRLSFGVGLYTLGASMTLKAKPDTNLYTIGGLSIATIFLITSAIFCLRKHCWSDGGYRREQGKIIEAEIKAKMAAEENLPQKTITVAYLLREYGLLKQFGIVNDYDFNRLFRDRIFSDNYSYPQLKEMLSVPGIGSAFGFTLDEQNKRKLYAKLLEFQGTQTSITITDEEKSALDADEQDLEIVRRHQAITALKENLSTYAQFLEIVGKDLRCYIESDAQEIKIKAIEYYVQQHKTVAEVLALDDAKTLQITAQDLVQAGAVNADLLKVNAGQMDYLTFRERHLGESLRFLNAHQRDTVKKAYTTSYKSMHDIPEDNDLFVIDNIAKIMQARFYEGFKTIRAFEDIEKKLGISVFSDQLVTKLHPQGMKKLVVESLKKGTYHSRENSLLGIYDLMTEDVVAIIDDCLSQETALQEKYEQEKMNLEDRHVERQGVIKQQHETIQNTELAKLRQRLQEAQASVNTIKDDFVNALAVVTKLPKDLKYNESLRTELQELTAKIKELRQKKAKYVGCVTTYALADLRQKTNELQAKVKEKINIQRKQKEQREAAAKVAPLKETITELTTAIENAKTVSKNPTKTELRNIVAIVPASSTTSFKASETKRKIAQRNALLNELGLMEELAMPVNYTRALANIGDYIETEFKAALKKQNDLEELLSLHQLEMRLVDVCTEIQRNPTDLSLKAQLEHATRKFKEVKEQLAGAEFSAIKLESEIPLEECRYKAIYENRIDDEKKKYQKSLNDLEDAHTECLQMLQTTFIHHLSILPL